MHRDVKLQNILVDTVPERPEHAFLSDFGLSKGTQSATRLTAEGQFLGTPDYSAPEQIRGGQVDGRTDQYALACVAYVLLTGELPFPRWTPWRRCSRTSGGGAARDARCGPSCPPR